jgi:hypothetical protein
MLAIESYGKWWRRDKIFWGTGGKGDNKGHLKGVAKGSKSIVVDFREQIGIYVLFNTDRDVVYVGQAGIGNKKLFGRLSDHRTDHRRDRWTYFSWFGLRGKNPTTDTLSAHHKPQSKLPGRRRKDALHETEAVLMAVVEPPLNKKGPNWTGSKEFFQFLDRRVPQDVHEIVSTLPERLSTLEIRINRILSKV